MVERHIAALPASGPRQQHLMVDGVEHVDLANFPHRDENAMSRIVQQNLTGMSFNDHVPEEFVTSGVNDPNPAVIKTRELRAVSHVDIFPGWVIHDAVRA